MAGASLSVCARDLVGTRGTLHTGRGGASRQGSGWPARAVERATDVTEAQQDENTLALDQDQALRKPMPKARRKAVSTPVMPAVRRQKETGGAGRTEREIRSVRHPAGAHFPTHRGAVRRCTLSASYGKDRGLSSGLQPPGRGGQANMGRLLLLLFMQRLLQ